MKFVNLLCTVVWTAVMSEPLMAANAFKKLSCHAVIGDQVAILNQEAMHLVWKTSGEDAFPILRNLASQEIPDSLLKAYDAVDVEVTVPLKSCQFNDAPRGNFSCAVGNDVPVAIKAETAFSNNDKLEVFKGKLSQLNIKTLYTGKNGDSYLMFALTGVSTNSQGHQASFSVRTDRFATYFSHEDGGRQNPDCSVDGGFVVAE